MNVFRFLCGPVACALISLMWSGCATEPKPAIVQQVEAAPTAVEGLVMARDHFSAVVNRVEQVAPALSTPGELDVVMDSLADSAEAVVVAGERALKVETVSPEEDALLRAGARGLNAKDPKWARLKQVLSYKADRLGGGSGFAYRVARWQHWGERMVAVERELRSRPYVVTP